MVEKQQPNPVIYIFLNKSLGMSVGKAAAQAAHATAMSFIDSTQKQRDLWKNSPHRTVIVLEARDEAHMKNIDDYLFDRDIEVQRIIDEGVNEIEPHTWTSLATPILDKNDEYITKTLSSFSLYRDVIEVNLKINK